jgi:(R,R)-butanediol dehydrogenase/meso-butanediol dehydrogenase/diacetyl reductase
MRVAVFNGPGKPLAIERVPDPEPGPEELVVKVGRCGICGSDLSLTTEGPFCYGAGFRMGHEYAGEVTALGRAVTGLKVGDRVACFPIDGCGACDACRAGRFAYCSKARPVFGGFGDYVALPSRNAVKLPGSLSLADGALVEPIACGLHALRMAGMQGGERILVLGAGSMGAAATFWARRLGAGRIVVAARSDRRHETALAMGADAVHSFADDAPDGLIAKLGGPPDIVAECVGKPGMIEQAVMQVRQGGTVASLGACVHAEPITGALCMFKEVRLLFPMTYTLGEFIETVKAFEAGAIRPGISVDRVIALEDLPATLEAMRGGAPTEKIHVDPTLEPSHA